MIRRPPSSPLFPYTPLSRSRHQRLVVRRIDGIEPLLGPVEVLSRPGVLVLVDLRLPAGADDMRDREEAEEHQAAVVDLVRSEEHTSELQSPCNLVCRLLLEK